MVRGKADHERRRAMVDNRLISPEDNRVPPEDSCPKCGESDVDRLVWTDEEFADVLADGSSVLVAGEHIKCATCGYRYAL